MLSSSGDLSGKELAVVKLMLQNCIKLLQQSEPEVGTSISVFYRHDNQSTFQFQIIVSAYYMLADLYLCRAPSSQLPCGLRTRPSPSVADTSEQQRSDGSQQLNESERKSVVVSTYPMVG